jgi:hypothetical protein
MEKSLKVPMRENLAVLTAELIGEIRQNVFLPDGHCGLWKGVMEKVILFHILHQHTGCQEWRVLAENWMDSLTARIDSVEEMGFADGLSGIGWGLEWLAQSGCLKGNTDSLLEDFDDMLYKVALYAPDPVLSLKDGTLGKISYFLKRYQSINPGTHRYKIICLQECLVVLSDEVREKVGKAIEKGVVSGIGGSSGMGSLSGTVAGAGLVRDGDIGDMADALIFLARFWPHKVNVVAVEQTIYDIIAYTPGAIGAIGPGIWLKAIKLAYARHYAGIKLNCRHWSKQGLQELEWLLDRAKAPDDFQRIDIIPILNRLYNQTGKKGFLEELYLTIDAWKCSNGPIDQGMDWHIPLLCSISCLSAGIMSWDEAFLYS